VRAGSDEHGGRGAAWGVGADGPPQSDGHDHPPSPETDINNRRSGQAEHPRECGPDAHAVCGRLSFNTRQPATRTAARPKRSAQAPNETSAANPLLTRPNPRAVHPQNDGRPDKGLLAILW